MFKIKGEYLQEYGSTHTIQFEVTHVLNNNGHIIISGWVGYYRDTYDFKIIYDTAKNTVYIKSPYRISHYDNHHILLETIQYEDVGYYQRDMSTMVPYFALPYTKDHIVIPVFIESLMLNRPSCIFIPNDLWEFYK